MKMNLVKNGIVSAASFLFDLTVRCFRCVLENTIHGILRIMNVGRKQTIPKVQNDLLLQPAVKLAAKIRRGELSSEELVKTYISRIEEVNGLINAVVDQRFTEAVKEARSVDDLVMSGRMTQTQIAEQYPLLGIPFTSKAAILVQGLSSACGLLSRKEMKAEEDCEAVKKLRSLGAIPLAITNTCELSMGWETYNNLNGRTNNPYDTTRTVGGSSGGEAALIASAGSVIGLGTDLGGSIRLPAFFTGIYGHKPTQALVPLGGQFPPVLKEFEPYFVDGPMVRYACDLKFVLSALIGKELTQQLKLHTPVDLRSIKVYYMLDDGGSPFPTPVSPDIREAMEKAVNLLSMECLVVEKVNLKYVRHGLLIFAAYILKIKEEALLDVLKEGIKSREKYSLQKKMLKWLLGKSEHTFFFILIICGGEFVRSIFTRPRDFFIKCGDQLKDELLNILQPGPAVFLYPTFSEVAAHHGGMLANFFSASYTATFNAAALPSTQCPLGFSTSGLPYGMQIVTAPNNDRLSIAIAEYLEEKLGGWVEPSSFSNM